MANKLSYKKPLEIWGGRRKKIVGKDSQKNTLISMSNQIILSYKNLHWQKGVQIYGMIYL